MINIALVGYGYWGPNIARNLFINPKTNLFAICDKSAIKLEKAHMSYSSDTSYVQDYTSLLNNPDIHAVAIAVETKNNYKIVMDFLNAGKHVFIEKPMSTSKQEAKEIMNLANKNNLIVHVDHIMVFHPIIKKLKDLIVSGELGELIYFDSSRMNLGPIKSDVSSMWDLAVHDLAVIDYLSEGREPFHIEAIGEKRFSKKGSLTYLTMKYNDFIAHLKSSWISPLKERRMIIAGTKKMAVFNDLNLIDKLMVFDSGIELDFDKANAVYGEYEWKVRSGDILIPYIPATEPLKNSIDCFISCLETNTKSISGPEQALRIIGILEKAQKKLDKSN